MIKVNYDELTGKVIGFNQDTTPYIEITDEERRKPLGDKYGYYAVVNGQFTVLHREPTAEEIQKDKENIKQKRLKEIAKWLNDNDWKVNKVFLGEWEQDDPRWLEYLDKRAQLRAEHEILTSEEV